MGTRRKGLLRLLNRYLFEVERGTCMKTDSERIKPVRSKDDLLFFGAPAIEDAEIEEVFASMKSERRIFMLGVAKCLVMTVWV